MRYILIHGLGQSPASWEATIAALGEQEKKQESREEEQREAREDGRKEVRENVLCPDLTELLRGRETVYAKLYEAFCDYCEALGEPVNLCGLSLGGILALQYAVEHPERVHSLVLIGTQYVMPKRLLKFQNMIFRLMPERAFRGTRFGRREFISLSKTMMDLDFSADLGKLRCPVLVVCGEKDSANRRAAVELRREIPRARLAWIGGTGHEVNVDAPKELGKLLGRFWQAGRKGKFYGNESF